MVTVTFYERSATRAKRLHRQQFPGVSVISAARWAVETLDRTDAATLARVSEVRVTVQPDEPGATT